MNPATDNQNTARDEKTPASCDSWAERPPFCKNAPADPSRWEWA